MAVHAQAVPESGRRQTVPPGAKERGVRIKKPMTSTLVSVMQSPDPGFAFAEQENERLRGARRLGAEPWSGAAPPDAEDLSRLVAEGLEKGFLTYDEIAAGLEDVGLSREQTEDFYTYLAERSIDLVEGEQHQQPSHEQP